MSKKPQLTLVNSDSRPGEMVALDSLSAEQQTYVTKLIDNYIKSATIIGVIVARDYWDLKPVVFADGGLAIIRSHDPALTLKSDKLQKLQSRLAVMHEWYKNLSLVFKIVERGGKIFVVRKYFDHSLRGLLKTGWEQKDLLVIARRLIALVDSIHQLGIAHGHICAENIMFSNRDLEKPYLVDAGFIYGRLHPLENNLAPELLEVDNPVEIEVDAATDIYGLGRVLNELLDSDSPQHYQAFIDSMSHSDPESRPDMQLIKQFFGVTPDDQLESYYLGGAVNEERFNQQYFDADEKRTSIDTKRVNQPKQQSALIYLLSTLLICVGFYFLVYGQPSYYLDEWNSGVVQRQIAVAESAVAGDKAAQRAILKVVRSGTEESAYADKIRPTVLRFLAKPHFWPELDGDSRRAAFWFALSPLLQNSTVRLPALESLHPALHVALAIGVAIESPPPFFERLSPESFFDLKPPYGSFYRRLNELGVTQPASKLWMIATQIVFGEKVLFDRTGSQADLGSDTKLLEVATAAITTSPASGGAAYNFLSLFAAYKDRLAWFNEAVLSDWSNISDTTRIMILSGDISAVKGDSLLLADLLRYPEPAVRVEAAEMLSKLVVIEPAILKLLTSPVNNLTRTETVSLISALTTAGEKRDAFIVTWFRQRPNPDTIVKLLVLLRDKDQEIFNLEGARYLIAIEHQLKMSLIRLLLLHKEPLVRAFAYSRLDPKDPEALELLKQSAIVEPIASIREQVLGKLGLGSAQK